MASCHKVRTANKRRNVVLRLAAMSFLLAGVLLPAAQAGDQAAVDARADTMEARVLACAACHGQQGQGTSNDYFPRLAGKPAGYLYNQLVAFRDGRRRYAPMNYLLEYLPDPYLREDGRVFRRAAAAVACRRPCRPPSSDVLAHGRRSSINGAPDGASRPAPPATARR